MYSPFVEAVKEKIYLSKLVIEFMLDDAHASYEDLLNRLETAVPPSGLRALTEDTLLRHAQFVCDQVRLLMCLLCSLSFLVIFSLLQHKIDVGNP